MEKKNTSEQTICNFLIENKQRITELTNSLQAFQGFLGERSLILKNASDLDWDELIRKSDELLINRDEFTLNPETLNLDFDKITPIVIYHPMWKFMNNGQVFKEVIDYFNKDYYIPGYEYVEWMSKNPLKHREILHGDDDEFFIAPGTIFGRSRLQACVGGICWENGKWKKSATTVNCDCFNNNRVILLPRNN